jgi:hypothetical protein
LFVGSNAAPLEATPGRCRHAVVVNALWSYVNTIGAMAMREPSGMVMGDWRRPNLFLTFPGQQILTNVMVS